MTKLNKRMYTSGKRDAQAAQTRSHILDCAKKLFQNEGYDQVTISKIAQAAEVSMPTVYAIFKSKRGVLLAMLDTALPQDMFTTLVEHSMQEKSPVKRLTFTAKLAREMYDAERGVMEFLHSASLVSPELKELEQERELRRYERQGEYVKKLYSDKCLAKGMTLQKARDILWSLTGRDLYRLLVLVRGWSSDQYEAWLAQLLVQSLLEPGTSQ